MNKPLPGVLITIPKNIPSIWKDEEALSSTRHLVLFDNYSQTNNTLTSWALKGYLGFISGIFGKWVGRTSFRFDLRDNDCLTPNEKTQTSPLSSRKVGFAHPSLPPTPCTSSKSCAHSGNIPTFHCFDSQKLQYTVKTQTILVITT